MAAKVEDALQKVTALPGVKAAFVFDQFQTIIARDVPGQYSNDILKRIAAQLYQLTLFSWKIACSPRISGWSMTSYAVYTRLFAKNFYLVVFMERNLEPADFRQPLNLSVLVLDRALRTEDVNSSESQTHGQGGRGGRSFAERDASKPTKVFPASFAGFASRISARPAATWSISPWRSNYCFRRCAPRRTCGSCADYALAHIVHPIKRQIIEKDSEQADNPGPDDSVR